MKREKHKKKSVEDATRRDNGGHLCLEVRQDAQRSASAGCTPRALIDDSIDPACHNPVPFSSCFASSINRMKSSGVVGVLLCPSVTKIEKNATVRRGKKGERLRKGKVKLP